MPVIDSPNFNWFSLFALVTQGALYTYAYRVYNAVSYHNDL
jgi:hypothetical protein